MKSLTIRIDDQTLDQFKALAEAQGQDVSTLLRDVIKAHLSGTAASAPSPDLAAVVEAAQREAKSRGLAVVTVISLWRRMLDPTVPIKFPPGGMQMVLPQPPGPTPPLPTPSPSTDLPSRVAAIEARALSQPLIRVSRPTSHRSELRGSANPTLEDQLKMVQMRLARLEHRMNEKDGTSEPEDPEK